jgi:hypothetical protein
VALLDSDDFWEPDHLERMSNAIWATQGRARFYFADAMRHFSDSKRKESFWAYRDFFIDGEFEYCGDATDWVMMPGQPMLLQAAVINREAYFEVGGFWASLLNREDTHLFFKLGLGGPACAVAGIGAHMMADGGNRLTLALSPREGHLYRVLMIDDLLGRNVALAPRMQLKRRLAESHYRLFSIYVRRGEWKTAVTHLWRSLQVDPKVIPQLIIGKVVGYLLFFCLEIMVCRAEGFIHGQAT